MTRWPPPVAITGAGAVTPAGLGWRGFGRAVLTKSLEWTEVGPTGEAAPMRLGFPLPPLPPEADVDPATRRRMSHAARLSAIAARLAVRDARWTASLEDAGFFLGVGASGGSVDELAALLRASTPHGSLDLAAVGTAGLRACNPLFTFQSMNNFTLCHAAIGEGTRGPNAAFFSRGAGTIAAIAEAAWALADGECPRALAGAADSALHPMTWAEGIREGWLAEIHPSEGAAILALEREPAHVPLAVLERAFVESSRVTNTAEAIGRAVDALADVETSVEIVVVAAALRRDRTRLEAAGRRALGSSRENGAKVVRLHRFGGESLAATPALAAVAALDLLVSTQVARVAALTVGLDGDVAVLLLRRPG